VKIRQVTVEHTTPDRHCHSTSQDRRKERGEDSQEIQQQADHGTRVKDKAETELDSKEQATELQHTTEAQSTRTTPPPTTTDQTEANNSKGQG